MELRLITSGRLHKPSRLLSWSGFLLTLCFSVKECAISLSGLVKRILGVDPWLQALPKRTSSTRYGLGKLCPCWSRRRTFTSRMSQPVDE